MTGILTRLYERQRPIITAHRGASGLFPENTLMSMRQAMLLGADMIEFDLRMTRDGIPVLLHDATIDRTSNGHGQPSEYTLAELRQFNFSHYVQEITPGGRSEQPFYPVMPIPTFEEVLQEFHGKIGMNIQVYANSVDAMKEICRLYRQYEMYDQGYLAINFTEAELVRSIDQDIDIAILPDWNTRSNPDVLRECRKFGCRFAQPIAGQVTRETFDLCRKIGLKPTVFFSDRFEENRRLLELGAPGFLTNRPDILKATIDFLTQG